MKVAVKYLVSARIYIVFDWMKKFEIISRSYLWLLIGFVIMAGSGILFFTNMRFSVEFTGGMNIRLATQLSADFATEAQQFLADAGYTDAKVAAQASPNYSDVVIATDVSDDAAMNTLAQQIKSYLLEEKIVSSDAEIIQLSVTGPSV